MTETERCPECGSKTSVNVIAEPVMTADGVQQYQEQPICTECSWRGER